MRSSEASAWKIHDTNFTLIRELCNVFICLASNGFGRSWAGLVNALNLQLTNRFCCIFNPIIVTSEEGGRVFMLGLRVQCGQSVVWFWYIAQTSWVLTVNTHTLVLWVQCIAITWRSWISSIRAIAWGLSWSYGMRGSSAATASLRTCTYEHQDALLSWSSVVTEIRLCNWTT